MNVKLISVIELSKFELSIHVLARNKITKIGLTQQMFCVIFF